MSEKAVSSEGLGSSSTTTLTSNGELSSRVEETPFKPDFVKYIENSNKNNPIDSYKMNSNEDILSKWRLRRKLEEASIQSQQQQQHNYQEPQKVNIEDYFGKKTPMIAYQAHNLTDQITNMQKQIQLLQPQPITVTKSTISQTTSSSTSTIPLPIKKKTETTAVQTSIDNFMNEKPTRDENRGRFKLSLTNNKSRKSSKSPTYKSTSTTIFDKSVSISSVQKSNISDLTKISSIEYEINSSPNNQNLIQNNTNDNSINNENINNSEIVVYKQIVSKTSNLINIDNSRINSNLIYDTSYYESDEILNILFNKLFFYQSKLG